MPKTAEKAKIVNRAHLLLHIVFFGFLMIFWVFSKRNYVYQPETARNG